MVFTVRYMLGILLVLISCSAIHTASISSRSIRETQETEVPRNESLHVATTTEPSITQLNNATTKTENPTNKEEDVDNTTEATATVASLVSATTNAEEPTTTEKEEITAEAKTKAKEINSLKTKTNQKSGSKEIAGDAIKTKIKQQYEEEKEEIPKGTEKTEISQQNEEEETTTVTVKTEIKQARTENGRSLDFDISKYTSPEFHNRNNVYNLPTSPENQKYVSADFDHKATTAREFTRFSEFTTPASEYFDAKYHEVEHGVAQDLEDGDHFFTNEEHTPKTSLNDILEKAKRNDSESNLDFLKYTSVMSENKEDKNSVHKTFENEQRLKINFDSVYNHTKLTDEEILVTSENPTVLTTTDSQEKVSFITTTKRPLPTKFSLVNKTLDQSSLLSNKIETETIKPVLLNHGDSSSEESKSKDNKINKSTQDDSKFKHISEIGFKSNSSDETKSKDSSDETKSRSSSQETKSKDSSDETKSKDSTNETKSIGSSEETKSKSSSAESKSKDFGNDTTSIDSSDETKSKDSSDETKSKESNSLIPEAKSKDEDKVEDPDISKELSEVSNLIKPPSEELTKSKNSSDDKISSSLSSEDQSSKSKDLSVENTITNLKSLDSKNLSPELNRSPEENVINVSKRGSTKFVENDISNPTTASSKQNKTNSGEESVEEITPTASVFQNNNSRDVNFDDNNVFAFVATTNSPETPTTFNLIESTETLYEITDERFDSTTEAIVYNTKKARELATTIKPETSSEEVFYEMTTETTTMPSIATEIDLIGTEQSSRLLTEADFTSTTEDELLISSTVAPEITTGGSWGIRDSTAFDALVTEAITTETPLESTALGVTVSNFNLIEKDDVNVTTPAVVDETTTEVTTETSADSSTVSTKSSEESSTLADIASTTASSPATQTQTDLPTLNKTSPTLVSITTIEPEFDEDEDDEYIDFSNRKMNTTSGNEEVDVLNPEAPEETSVKSDQSTTTVNSTQQPTTVSYIQQPTTVSPITTVKEERGVDAKTTKASEVTTMETTTEHEDVTETLTEGSVLTDQESNDGTVIAITISTIGAICLVLLAILLFIMRRRQRKFNYGQRCTPVSLDSYSMDNVSVYNSVRRKTAIRDSKRSYGNPAFDDATVSQPLNFQALVKYANSVDEIATEFEAVPMVTARMSELPEGCEVKNRYANVIPLPETRVVLSSTEDDPTGDYINANFVTGPKGVRGYYIACQAPMNNTVNDFWRMIWEQQSKVILMLTHLYETGVEKCVDYLPPSEVLDCHRLFGDYQVTLKNREVKDKYIISSLQLKNMVTNSWREVTHFWYLGWPEKGVPSEENSIIAFLIEARSYVKLVQNSTDIKIKDTSNGGVMNQDVSPVVVHCSPGTGRTGTVIACDIAIREFELKRLVDIPKIVYRIRRDRASSVQTKDQYTFIYRVINLYATKLTGGALDSI